MTRVTVEQSLVFRVFSYTKAAKTCGLLSTIVGFILARRRCCFQTRQCSVNIHASKAQGWLRLWYSSEGNLSNSSGRDGDGRVKQVVGGSDTRVQLM